MTQQSKQGDQIVVEVYHPNTERTIKEAFQGRFLIGDENSGETFHDDGSPARGLECSVALTNTGNIVLLIFASSNGEKLITNMTVYKDFDALKAADCGYPEELLATVADEMYINYFVEQDT